MIEREKIWQFATDEELANRIDTKDLPLSILREYAGRLRKDTKGVFEEFIKTERKDDIARHIFYIQMPALNNYRYKIFEIEDHMLVDVTKTWPVFYPYPVTLHYHPSTNADVNFSKKCETPQEFRDYMLEHIKSESTRKILGSLAALTKNGMDID